MGIQVVVVWVIRPHTVTIHKQLSFGCTAKALTSMTTTLRDSVQRLYGYVARRSFQNVVDQLFIAQHQNGVLRGVNHYEKPGTRS